MTNNTASTQELRGKTDQSLEEERVKTDEYIEQSENSVEEETDEAIRLTRLASDKEIESNRAEVDLEKEQRFNGTDGTRVVDSLFARERKQADEVRTVEREEEDHARTQEHVQKQMITEALLAHERQETDCNLLDERVHADRELITRDQLFMIIGHELKNSFIAISIFAGRIRSGPDKEPVNAVDLLTNIGAIEKTTADMDRMISDLLDIERIAHNQLQLSSGRFDLQVLLQECVDQFAPIVSDRPFSMTIDTAPEPIFANFDHDRILQVLSSLIGNSLKSMPDGGTIVLSARKQETQVEISVTDNGPGIPEQAQLQIFKRFSQLDLNGHRGLGLFIAQWIVETHKGRLWVTSDPGKGSTRSFTLPLSE